MDFQAKQLSVVLSLWATWRAVLATTGAILLLLVVLSLIGQAPRPLTLLVVISFIGWSALYWNFRRKDARFTWRTILFLLLPWAVILTLFLAALFAIDRGGWLWFKATGYDVAAIEDWSDQIDLPLADFVTRHPFFGVDPQNAAWLVLPRGEYVFKETVIIPRGTALTIEPGAVLRFGAGRSLVSYSPISARGAADAPIVFTARHKLLKWGVVGIVETEKSVFQHTRFEGGRQTLVNGIDFVANLNVIRADVEIVQSQFLSAFGKDAVNVRYGNVLIRDNLFRDSQKDCLDLDGGAGEVSHNQFIDCEDEGIDLSENNSIQVFDNVILDSHGGRIAAEENLEQLRSSNTLGYSKSR